MKTRREEKLASKVEKAPASVLTPESRREIAQGCRRSSMGNCTSIVLILALICFPLASKSSSPTQREIESEIILNVVYPCVANMTMVTTKTVLDGKIISASKQADFLVQTIKTIHTQSDTLVKMVMDKSAKELMASSPASRKEIYKLSVATCTHLALRNAANKGLLARPPTVAQLKSDHYLEAVTSIGMANEVQVQASDQGFRYFNVNMVEQNVPFVGTGLGYMGEITNDSGKNYDIVNFKISLYRKNGELIAVQGFPLFDFANGTTHSFDTGPVFNSGLKDQVKSFKIRFSGGVEERKAEQLEEMIQHLIK